MQETNNGGDNIVSDCEEQAKKPSPRRKKTIFEDEREWVAKHVAPVLEKLSDLHCAMLGFVVLAVGVFIWAATVVYIDIGFLDQAGIRNVICPATGSQRNFLGSSILLPILTMFFAAAENIQENGMEVLNDYAGAMFDDDETEDSEDETDKTEDPEDEADKTEDPEEEDDKEDSQQEERDNNRNSKRESNVI